MKEGQKHLAWKYILVLTAGVLAGSASAYENMAQPLPVPDLLKSKGEESRPPIKVGAVQRWQNANDYYYYPGNKVPLLRSAHEYAVKFSPSVSARIGQSVARSLTPSAEVVMAAPVRSGRLYVVKSPETAAAVDLEAAMGSMRTRPDVAYAFPVFKHPRTGTRVLLTDEVALKLAADASVNDLITLHAGYGLTVVEKKGASQYVLRVANPAAVNPLVVANALAESEHVQWAEPNFVQEF